MRLLSLMVSVLLAASLLAAGCDEDDKPTAVTATATAESTPLALPSSATPTTRAERPAPPEPYLKRFLAGEVIDVAPAVVFVDQGSGAADAWVIPGMSSPEFAVAPDGTYVVYQTGTGELRLLRTDDGSDRATGADSLPIELGPDDSGFVATAQDRFVATAFNGLGEGIGSLWLGGVSPRTAVSWSPDGTMLAHTIYQASYPAGGGPRLQVTLRSLRDWPPANAIDLGPTAAGVSLEWSPDSERLAVVAADRLFVLGREGEVYGQYDGRFGGTDANPRWSADGAFLYVGWMPDSGGEVAYVFSSDAEPVFRFVTPSYAGGCGGEVWLDAEVFEFGNHNVRVDGTFALHNRTRRDVWNATRLGVTLAGGTDFHLPHYGHRGKYGELADGRLVFATFTGPSGHGGCGEGWSGFSQEAPHVERPPYSGQ